MPATSMPPLPKRLLVVMPTWLGDCIMATPTLRALRQLMPEAHIAALIKSNCRPVLDGCPWVDRVLTSRRKRPGRRDDRRRGQVPLARRLSRGNFDAAILLPNSFRSAMLVSLAGIPRRIGYDRDGRGFMLTDRLLPRRDKHGFVPVSARDYYLGFPCYLGANHPSNALELFISEAENIKADGVMQRTGLNTGQSLVLLNPGASKASKRWPPKRFAAIADSLASNHDVAVAVTGSPSETPLLEAVVQVADTNVINLATHSLTLGSLKAIIARASLVITNDTGPRHIAAALNTPLVTLFGPTDPAWAEVGFAQERQLIAPDKTMDGISIDDVKSAANELLGRAIAKG